MNNGPVVWVMQQPDETRVDLASVRGYGELVPLLDKRPAPSIDPDKALAELRLKIRDVRDGDYLLDTPGCDPVCAFLAGVALAEVASEEPLTINWLRWDRRTDESGQRTRFGYYTPVKVTVD